MGRDASKIRRFHFDIAPMRYQEALKNIKRHIQIATEKQLLNLRDGGADVGLVGPLAEGQMLTLAVSGDGEKAAALMQALASRHLWRFSKAALETLVTNNGDNILVDLYAASGGANRFVVDALLASRVAKRWGEFFAADGAINKDILVQNLHTEIVLRKMLRRNDLKTWQNEVDGILTVPVAGGVLRTDDRVVHHRELRKTLATGFRRLARTAALLDFQAEEGEGSQAGSAAGAQTMTRGRRQRSIEGMKLELEKLAELAEFSVQKSTAEEDIESLTTPGNLASAMYSWTKQSPTSASASIAQKYTKIPDLTLNIQKHLAPATENHLESLKLLSDSVSEISKHVHTLIQDFHGVFSFSRGVPQLGDSSEVGVEVEVSTEHCLPTTTRIFCRQSPWNSSRREC